MERVTQKDERGYYLVGDGIYSDWGVPEKFRGDDVDRLAAYEEAGLEPDTVSAIRDIVLDISGDLDRLRELAEADRDGRCVVLPEGGCEDKDGENALKSAMHTCFYHNNPVTRFIADAVAEKLTREEAEAALRREQDGNRI